MARPDLNRICKEKFDLLVVGGGINGAGVARDAALRGLRVLLVEKDDFAFGTSSRSTKLVHGGLRYLENGELSLVRESLRERWLLATRLAPHLVKTRPILFPVCRGDHRPAWMIRAGLWMYDLLAGSKKLEKHRWLDPNAALAAEPALGAEGLRGAGLFYDCQMNDARLTLETVLGAQQAGAVCLNAVSLQSAAAASLGQVRARLRDRETGQEAQAQAHLLVNAAGPWVDQVLGASGWALPPKVKPSKGIHLVARLPLRQHAVLAPARSDNRVFFIIPWKVEGSDLCLVGTTEGDYAGNMDHVRAQAGEVDYLVKETRRVLPGSLEAASDLVGTYAGLRPLSAPRSDALGHFKVSREAVLHVEGAVLSVTGGKFTSYRQLAQDVVDRAQKLLGRAPVACTTHQVPLPGAGEAPCPGVDEETRAHLVDVYGSRAGQVASLIAAEPALGKKIHPDHATLYAQALYAAGQEQALTLRDFYLRRSFLGLVTPPDHASVPRVAALMARELGWDAARQDLEMESLRAVVNQEYRA